jgi:hypothetical protein
VVCASELQARLNVPIARVVLSAENARDVRGLAHRQDCPVEMYTSPRTANLELAAQSWSRTMNGSEASAGTPEGEGSLNS